MRFVLEFAILCGGLMLLVTVSKLLYSIWSRNRAQKIAKEEEMWRNLKIALSSNSRHRLEDILILHNKDLPKEIKPVIQSRIDDLVIKESDEQLENSLKQELNK
jgi:hypothetical protein